MLSVAVNGAEDWFLVICPVRSYRENWTSCPQGDCGTPSEMVRVTVKQMGRGISGTRRKKFVEAEPWLDCQIF